MGRGGALPLAWPPCCRRRSRSGAADLVFTSTVEYIKKRVQFGRTIGSFQAIKHRLADLLLDLEGMRAAAHYAALALGDGLPDAAEAVATAGRLRRRHLRPSLRRGAPAARRHRVHLGTRHPPVRAAGEGQPGALRRRGVAPRAPRPPGRGRPAAGRGGMSRGCDRPAHPRQLRRVSGHAACLPRGPQADPGVEAAHRPARARERRRRRAPAGLRPGDLRRRLRPRPLLGRTGRSVRAAHPGTGAGRGRGSPRARQSRWWPAPSSISAPTSNAPRTCRRWHGATTSGPSCSASPTPAAISPRSRHGPSATATPTWWWGRRCGARGPNGPTTATCWRAPSRSTARPASRPSFSTCGVPGWTCDPCAR